MEKSGEMPTDTPCVTATKTTRKTSRKNAASTRSNIKLTISMLREGFQTIYAETMVVRGHLAAMLDLERREPSLNSTKKLMALNHQLDALISESETILGGFPGMSD